MAVQQMQHEPTTTRRIHRRPVHIRRRRDHGPDLIRGVVQHSTSVDAAVAAVSAIDTAWADASSGTREAVALMLAILDLSDDAAEAAAVFARLHAHLPTARSVLDEAQRYIGERYPGSAFELRFGEEDVRLGMTFLYAFLPAKDYPAFKSRYDHVSRWWTKAFPEAGSTLILAPRSGGSDV